MQCGGGRFFRRWRAMKPWQVLGGRGGGGRVGSERPRLRSCQFLDSISSCYGTEVAPVTVTSTLQEQEKNNDETSRRFAGSLSCLCCTHLQLQQFSRAGQELLHFFRREEIQMVRLSRGALASYTQRADAGTVSDTRSALRS